MENQHRAIKGYRELGQTEVDLMDTAKDIGGSLRVLIEVLEVNPEVDKRWLNVARTDLQKGVMSLVRSIAKPTTF